jgi:hypothetical protein
MISARAVDEKDEKPADNGFVLEINLCIKKRTPVRKSG